MPKYIFVTGGVLSGLGKGIAGASVGHILSYKYNVIPIKCDGYLNTDPGTMNPQEHGEVFVLDDGSEVDMDFGHYERFLGCTCSEIQSLTMGKVFSEIQRKERKGDYLGKTVQFIPHVTDLIKDKFKEAAKKSGADIVLIEIGGTIGDIENELYVEASRQLALEVGKKNAVFIHLTYIPILDVVKEQKSKPTQQSVRSLLERGISPDIIIGRCSQDLDQSIKQKIAIFCNVSTDCVFSGSDVKHVYEIPFRLYEQGIVAKLNELLDLNLPKNIPLKWTKLLTSLTNPKKELTIAICGKYTALEDSYASIVEAIRHCAAVTQSKITIKMIETTNIVNQDHAKKALQGIDAVIVPGGFGNRGTEGKIEIIRYVRENKIPFLGICLGLQLAVIEYARNKCDIHDATSEEFDEQGSHVIAFLPDQKNITQKGGTMRLGSYPALIKKGTTIAKVYDNAQKVFERHRHRYEVNPKYHEILEKNGLTIAGISPDKNLVEFISIESHPYFVATQAHPELKSKLEAPAPLFLGLVKAALKSK